MDPNTVWTVAAVLVPGFAAFAFGLAAMTPASFGAARVCFWLSALTLCACASTWTWLTEFTYRLAIGCPVVLASGVALILCLRWVDSREALSQPVEPVRLLLEINPFAKLPDNSRGVAGVFQLCVGDPSGIGSMGQIFNTDKEMELDWSSYGRCEVAKCELTSFSAVPIVEVQLDFEVLITKTYPASDVLCVGTWDLRLTKLLPGEDKKVTIYIYNREEHFIRIRPPRVATFAVMGNTKRRTAPLPRINMAEFLLFGVPKGENDAATS